MLYAEKSSSFSTIFYIKRPIFVDATTSNIYPNANEEAEWESLQWQQQ